MEIPVLYEDNHLLVLDKPAGLATMGLPEGHPTLLTWAKEYIRQRYHKPGNVYLGVVSRLDVPVSGVVLLARTSKAASRLSEQFRRHLCRKRYWAILGGVPKTPEGELRHWIVHDKRFRRVHIEHAPTPLGREARLRYRTLAVEGRRALVEIELITGRKHQIRAQFAAIGHPIVGDLKYGSRESFPVGIALHGRWLTVVHPTKKEEQTFVAAPPKSWDAFRHLWRGAIEESP
ncbi:MAG: RluA family pseudouridine synthase [Planctomycetota bacterium]|nr:MAG: RluA family pseudouridine synthase [Planctomycetota bacterium]